MKKSLLLALTLLCISSLAMAQAGNLGVFADPAGTSCDLNSLTVYVVHMNSPATTASQFSLQAPPGLIHLATVAGTGNLLLGNALIGAGVAYGMCKVSPIYVAMIIYSGVANPCEIITVEDDPSANPPGIYMADCTLPNPVQFAAGGGAAYFFNDGSCPCDVPAEDTSWGQIKALYQ